MARASDDRRARIRALNDAFRRTFIGGRVLFSAAVDALPSDVKVAAVRKVTTFSDFTPDNDPHDEHDFGSFELAGHTFFWQIDYYDRNLALRSEDASDPARTARVLTIMLAEEY